MKSASMQNFARPIFVFGVIIFLFVGFFGFGHLAMMDSSGQMSGCLLPSMATFCKMSTLQHIASWQNLFAALMTKDAVPLLILFIFSLVLIVRAIWLTPKLLEVSGDFSWFSRIFVSMIFSPLEEAYSDGILNPKTF